MQGNDRDHLPSKSGVSSHLFLELYDNMVRYTKYCRIKEEDFGLEKGGIFVV